MIDKIFFHQFINKLLTLSLLFLIFYDILGNLIAVKDYIILLFQHPHFYSLNLSEILMMNSY
jgi:hypothetical protein